MKLTERIAIAKANANELKNTIQSTTTDTIERNSTSQTAQRAWAKQTEQITASNRNSVKVY